MEIPTGQQAVMPYLIVKGALKFIEFTKTVFNAEVTYCTMQEDENKVKHAQIMISGSTIMFCDATDQWDTANTNLFVYVASADDTYKKATDTGAESLMGLSDQDYGRTCGIKDPFGNTWWITSAGRA